MTVLLVVSQQFGENRLVRALNGLIMFVGLRLCGVLLALGLGVVAEYTDNGQYIRLASTNCGLALAPYWLIAFVPHLQQQSCLRLLLLRF